MPTNPQADELVEVIQADRDAAAANTTRGHGQIDGYTYSAQYMIRNGHWDYDPLVRAFARHRAAAVAAERERAARVAEVYSSIHVEKRDDALHDKNMPGALTKARQAQTCDEIATAIRSTAPEGGEG